jgi:DNA-binding MarR family transcriptional regulator
MATLIDHKIEVAASSNPDECIQKLVQVLPRVSRVFKSQMRGGPLTAQQVFMLMSIQDLNELHPDGAQPGELARRACTSSAAITAALDDLVADGFCVRAHSEKDRRKVLVRVTPLGSEVLREARDSAANAMRGMLDGWSAAQLARLYAVLDELDVSAAAFMERV